MMSPKFHEFVHTLGTPLAETKKFVNHVLARTTTQVVFISFLVLFFAEFVLLGYEGSPCTKGAGVCRKTVLNFYSMFKIIFVFILFIFWMKLTASGVKNHGITPHAFANVFATYFFFNMLNLVLVELTKWFRFVPGQNVPINVADFNSPEWKFSDTVRIFTAQIINGFAGKNTWGDDGLGDNNSGNTNAIQYNEIDALYYGVILGILAGSLA